MKIADSMNAPRHTPGPWTFRLWAMSDADAEECRRLLHKEPTRMLDNEGSAPILGPDGTPIARATLTIEVKRGQAWCADDAERDANAQLIASAPDLLAALKEIIQRAEHDVGCDQSTGGPGGSPCDCHIAIARAAVLKATGAA